MRAGSLRHRVTIQQRAAGQDAAGQPVGEWEPIASMPSVWANILHLNGAETIRSESEVSIVRASIRIRYRADVTVGMRVIHGSVVYDIKAAVPDEATRECLDLVCETGANNG